MAAIGNKWAVIGGVAVVALALAACAGLDFGNFVKVPTPAGIAQDEGLPRKMGLKEASLQYQIWYEKVKAEGEQWKANIETGDQVAGMLSQLSLQGLNQLGPALGGVPVAGPTLVGLLGVGAFVLGRMPLRKEKEASFNSGLKKGAEAAATAL